MVNHPVLKQADSELTGLGQRAPRFGISEQGAACIRLRGVRVHNLQGIDLDIPREQLIVICGVSGSGKTSLALDTLFAEGQRRYIEGFSAYTRQFLARLPRPQAQLIEGIPPAIAVTRKHHQFSRLGTLGTTTEIIEYLRLLYARFGEVHCPQCQRRLHIDSIDSITQCLITLPRDAKLILAVRQFVASPEELIQLADVARKQGIVRWLVGTEIKHLGESPPLEEWYVGLTAGSIFFLLDRLTPDSSPGRIRGSIEGALKLGNGACHVFVEEAAQLPPTMASRRLAMQLIDGVDWQRLLFQRSLWCEPCGLAFPRVEPQLLSFSSAVGACPICEGLGRVPGLDPGSQSRENPCPECQGTRLRREGRAIRLGGIPLAQLCGQPIAEVLQHLQAKSWGNGSQSTAIASLVTQIASRLRSLDELGLGYLALDRPLRTLSSGEAQRVAIAAAVGSSLINMMYVLDEPSVGLHPVDVERLVKAICDLRDRGNTVVVVDHEETMIEAANHVIEIGPAAGESGGEVTFQGSPHELREPNRSLTGEYLSGRRGSMIPERRRATDHGWVKLRGAAGHNLQNIDVAFPLGVLCLVTGLSGSGKSCLVEETLYPALCQRKRQESPPPLPFRDVVGDGQFDDVMMIDQSPIGKSPRSNAVTFTKAFNEIREVFSQTLIARTRNYQAGHFSFNVAGGRCAACEGDGSVKIDMQFLADVRMVCAECQGKRYRRDTLDILYRGKTIADVLEMTVRQAFLFFRGETKVQAKLQCLIDVGLEYIRLGQAANTLSAGEAQRLKLATFLSTTRRGRTLFLMDEPTKGLHFSDIVVLLDCFDALLNVGHSLIVVEHNVQLMAAADHLIDLGPGASSLGGRVITTGTPEEVAACVESATGRVLAEALRRWR